MPDTFFLKISQGFGNKLCNVLIGLFFKYINNATFYTLILNSEHDKDGDNSIIEIFPEIKDYMIIFNNWNEVDQKFNKIKSKDIWCKSYFDINNFKFASNSKTIHFIRGGVGCYKHIFDIYNNLPLEYKNLIRINEKLISNKIINITNKDYIAVHIRYGDKLKISLNILNPFNNKLKNQYTYIIYTPEFYIKIIKYFLKKKLKIYILTDDVKIVEYFIMRKINNKNVILLDLPFLESFYILSKSKFNILSTSTFSFLATLINKKLKKAYIVQRPLDIKNYSIPDEFMLKDENKKIKKLKNKKYILNYNIDLMKQMININN